MRLFIDRVFAKNAVQRFVLHLLLRRGIFSEESGKIDRTTIPRIASGKGRTNLPALIKKKTKKTRRWNSSLRVPLLRGLGTGRSQFHLSLRERFPPGWADGGTWKKKLDLRCTVNLAFHLSRHNRTHTHRHVHVPAKLVSHRRGSATCTLACRHAAPAK